MATKKGQKLKKAGPTIQPTLSDIIYAAGFFDGEGCVSMPKIRERTLLRVMIANTNKDPLNFMKERFGGHVYLAHANGGNFKPCYSWHTAGRPALSFVAKILPYSKVKRRALTNAMMWGVWAPGRNKPFTTLINEAHDLLHRDMRWNNARKGVQKAPPPAVNLQEFGYKEFTLDHLQQALEIVQPFQYPEYL
jgi:hypothetical protein